MNDLRTYYAGYRLRLIMLEQARLEMRARHWIKGEHGYFAGSYSTGGGGKTSAKPVDKAEENDYNLFRKTKNTGAFAELQEPMQKKHIKRVLNEMGIDTQGIEFDIVREKALIGKGIFGYTFPNGKRIQLYPDAFSSREELVKTIGHERIHCEQIRLFGAPESISEIITYERAAKHSEEYWWTRYLERSGFNENNKMG